MSPEHDDGQVALCDLEVPVSQGTLPFEATDQNSRPVVDVHPSEGVA